MDSTFGLLGFSYAVIGKRSNLMLGTDIRTEPEGSTNEYTPNRPKMHISTTLGTAERDNRILSPSWQGRAMDRSCGLPADHGHLGFGPVGSQHCPVVTTLGPAPTQGTWSALHLQLERLVRTLVSMYNTLRYWGEISLADEPYSNFGEEELILHDYLAIDRTILANDRTVLAFVRTALVLFVTGITLIKLFHPDPIGIIGWAFITLGMTVLIIGLARYRKVQRRISDLNLEHESAKRKPLTVHPSTSHTQTKEQGAL